MSFTLKKIIFIINYKLSISILMKVSFRITKVSFWKETNREYAQKSLTSRLFGKYFISRELKNRNQGHRRHEFLR